MNSTRLAGIRRLWLRLAVCRVRSYGRYPGNQPWRFLKKKIHKSKNISVEVISAVTGETTRAFVNETSRRKYAKWLSYENNRAQFEGMLLPENTTWSRMTEDAWKDYPVIIKVGQFKAPYVIDRIGAKIEIEGKMACEVFLKTVDNINYLETIAVKKKMAKELLEIVKKDLAAMPKLKKKNKRK